MPATIHITDEAVTVELEGADKLWALKSRLEVPLENVAGADPAEQEAKEWLHGFRLGGTHIPGVITAGRFYSHGQLVFWDVHEPERAIAIQLRDEHFDKLIVEVVDPEREISRIRQAAAAAVPAQRATHAQRHGEGATGHTRVRSASVRGAGQDVYSPRSKRG